MLDINKTYSPFNPGELKSLELHQNSAVLKPYRCKRDQTILTPRPEGLICLKCHLIQSWADKWSTNQKELEIKIADRSRALNEAGSLPWLDDEE